MTLLGQGNQTEVTVRMRFASVEERQQAIRDYGAAQGLRQTYDRLATLLA